MDPLPFVKLSAAGNDFVLVTADDLPASPEAVARAVCPRRTSLGADGLIVVRAPSAPGGVWEARHHEPDGARTFCLNAIRGVAAWVRAEGRWAGGTLEVETCAGRLPVAEDLAVGLPPPRRLEARDLPGPSPRGWFADVGNPQLVIVLDDPAALEAPDLMERARALRWRRDLFPEGTNVNHVARGRDGVWRIRTFERGVEGETLACGTGVVASACAVVAAAAAPAGSLRFLTRGGDELTVRLAPGGERVWAAGPASLVARGAFCLPLGARAAAPAAL